MVVCSVVANLLNTVAAVVVVVRKKFLNVTAAVGTVVDKLEAIVGITSGSALWVPSIAFALRKLCSLMLSEILFTVNSVVSEFLYRSKKNVSNKASKNVQGVQKSKPNKMISMM